MKNKTIVIIGGSSGIGLEIALQVKSLGANLIIGARNEEKLKKAAGQLDATWIQVDAHDRRSLNSFFEALPLFDHVISMVGDVMGGGFLEPSEETIRHVIESKFFTNLAIAKLAAQKIKEGGSIIFTSGSGGSPSTASAAYIGNMSIKAMVEGLAKELAPKVRVNTVAPFWMDTPFWRDQSVEEVGKTKEYLEGMIPLRRIGTVAEVAGAYVFLMQNSFITGQQIMVDGGVMLA